jgi:plastocyanin
MRGRTLPIRMILLLLAASVAATGCSNGAKVGATSGSTTASPTVRPIDPFFDFGDTILMTDTGFQPKNLLTNPGLTVTWKNQTDHAWTVDFDHQDVHSKTIPAGGTFTWTSPTPISVTYHDGEHPAFHGSITVQV